MKWINLAERQPPRTWHGIVRLIGDKNTKGAFLWWNDAKKNYTGVFYQPDSISAGIDTDLNKYEWLDEEAFSMADHDDIYIRYVILTEKCDDLEEELEEIKKKTRYCYPPRKEEFGLLMREDQLERIYTQTEVDALLAQQHSNTLDDAIEAITKTYIRGKEKEELVSILFLQMQRDIKSLPIRKP